jgi:hypothetical protein
MEKIIALIPVIIVAFTILSHTLAYVAQVLKDLGKNQPGWFDTATTYLGKIVDFLNGVKAKQSEAPKV